MGNGQLGLIYLCIQEKLGFAEYDSSLAIGFQTIRDW